MKFSKRQFLKASGAAFAVLPLGHGAIASAAANKSISAPLKKLTDEIWEFRIRFSNKQIRLLAFWDKRDNKNTLVIATNGFIKKRRKPQKLILIKRNKTI